MSALSLIQVLDCIPNYSGPDVLVGFQTADDAGVFRLDNERALVQTIDFFSPVVDDPYLFGAIAAANALSDVYAMGGSPVTAMAIACFPERDMEIDVLGQIMLGGVEKLHEAGVCLLGGHSVSNREIKFGYSITGLVHPNRIVSNAGAQPGDALVLTKPLGIGILTSGIKLGKTPPEAARRAAEVMSALNRTASEIMTRCRCHAATDITGYGLLGHGYEMAEAGNVALRIVSQNVHYIPDAYPLAAEGVLPGIAAKTWKLIAGKTSIAPSVSEPLKKIMLDPQTSGGLLISVAPEDLEKLMSGLEAQGIESRQVGSVEEFRGDRIIVE